MRSNVAGGGGAACIRCGFCLEVYGIGYPNSIGVDTVTLCPDPYHTAYRLSALKTLWI